MAQGTTDREEIAKMAKPAFCRQSFVTGNVRYNAGEVYETDAIVANNFGFFTEEIPDELGPVDLVRLEAERAERGVLNPSPASSEARERDDQGRKPVQRKDV